MRWVIFIILLASFIGSVRAHTTSDSFVMNYMREMGIPLTYNNRIELLIIGREKFIDLSEAIRHARHHIHLEYFNFHSDSIANSLFGLLTEKAKEGMEVHAMFDAFGNWSNDQPLKKHHLQAIKVRDIEIVKFDLITFPYINRTMHRDHRKIVMIGGETGYTGGMNIVDYYISGLPRTGKWHDIYMHIEGDAVHYLQGIFLTMWNRETGQHIGGPAYFPNLPRFPGSIAEEILIVGHTPRETPRPISHACAASVEAARKNVQTVSPYLVPVKSIRKAIRKTSKKGTEVGIVISVVSSTSFTPEVSLYIAHKPMKRGARVYLFRDGFHRSKTMMVDSTFCTVGTASLNSRSLHYDYETSAFIFDPATTSQLSSVSEKDKQNSILFTPEVWRKRSDWKKFVGWVGSLLTPFL